MITLRVSYKIQEPSIVRAGVQKYNASSLQEDERTTGSTINNQGGREGVFLNLCVLVLPFSPKSWILLLPLHRTIIMHAPLILIVRSTEQERLSIQ
jgi:hypothetical protein